MKVHLTKLGKIKIYGGDGKGSPQSIEVDKRESDPDSNEPLLKVSLRDAQTENIYYLDKAKEIHHIELSPTIDY